MDHSRRQCVFLDLGINDAASWRAPHAETTENGVFRLWGLVAVNRRRGKRGKTDGDVLGSGGLGRAVAHPFPLVGDDSLSGPHVERSPAMLDAEHPGKDNRIFI